MLKSVYYRNCWVLRDFYLARIHLAPGDSSFCQKINRGNFVALLFAGLLWFIDVDDLWNQQTRNSSCVVEWNAGGGSFADSLRVCQA